MTGLILLAAALRIAHVALLERYQATRSEPWLYGSLFAMQVEVEVHKAITRAESKR